MTAIEDLPDTSPVPDIDITEPNWPATERSPVALLSLVSRRRSSSSSRCSSRTSTPVPSRDSRQDLLRFFEQLPDRVRALPARRVAVRRRALPGRARRRVRRAPSVRGSCSSPRRPRRRPPRSCGCVEHARRPAPSARVGRGAHRGHVDHRCRVPRRHLHRRRRGARSRRRRVRRVAAGDVVAWSIVGLVVFFRILSGTEVPVDLALARHGRMGGRRRARCSCSGFRPIGRPGRQVAAALARSGVTAARAASGGRRRAGSTPWFGTTRVGRRRVHQGARPGRARRGPPVPRSTVDSGCATSATNAPSRRCAARSSTKR